MTSAYLTISFLKQSPLPEQQWRIFLSYLPEELLKEFLSCANIYKAKKNRSKHDLIDLIIIEKNIEIRHRPEDDLTQEVANELLENSKFVKQTLKENNIPITPPEIKTKHKLLINN